MKSRYFQATQDRDTGFNHGKFLVQVPDDVDWSVACAMDPQRPLFAGRGWQRDKHVLVFDLETGEGARFLHGGYAKADLTKTRIWVCPLFEPFLAWLYQQDLTTLADLPQLVVLPNAPAALAGYRRDGDASFDDDMVKLIQNTPGFTDLERDALLAILEHGRTARELATILSTTQARATTVLSDLVRRGLVEHATGAGKDVVYGLHPLFLTRIGVKPNHWRPT